MRSPFPAGMLLTLLALRAWGTPYPYDLVDVPVARMVGNLEKRLARVPNSAQLHYTMARVHAIAYAQGVSSMRLGRMYGSQTPPDERQVGNEWRLPKEPGARSGDRKHLEQAVNHYREATRLDPADLAAALGCGWVLEQIGDRSG